ncbi:CocE/NonD family hydrolase [Saccharopolyspora sp. NPDC000995]
MSTTAVLLAAVLIGSAATSAQAAEPDPNAWTYSQASIPVGDGAELDALIYRPAWAGPDDRSPVILELTPYNVPPFFDPGSPETYPKSGQPGPLTERGLFARGYTLVSVSLRGIGRSPGCLDYGGAQDQADARAVVEWAASQQWSTGKVGMLGISYPGWTTLMAAANAPRGLAAVVPMEGVSNLYNTMYTNRVGTYVNHALGPVMTGLSYTPPDVSYGPLATAVWLQQRNATCAVNSDNHFPQMLERDFTSYWSARDLTPKLTGSTIPFLQLMGFYDVNVRPVTQDYFSTLSGPHHQWVGQWDHGTSWPRMNVFYDEVMRFFDRYVKGVSKENADVEADPGATVQEGDGRWRAEAQWPPRDAVNVPLPIKPGEYVDADDSYGGGYSEAFRPDPTRPINKQLGVLPQMGTWTFTPPLPYPAHIAGMARATLDLKTSAPDVTAIVQLYDVDREAQTAQQIASGAYLVPGPAGTHGVSFDLYPQDWRIQPGHSVGVLITASDPARWEPGRTGTLVTVEGGNVSVPFLRYNRDAFLQGEVGGVVENRETFNLATANIAGNTVDSPVPPPQEQNDCWQASPNDNPRPCPAG